MSAPGPSPYLFLVGCPRSGTTLLQRMLDNHPRLAVANDTHFIPRAIDHLPEDAGDPPLSAELIERVRGYHRFPRLGLDEEAVTRAAGGQRTYSGFVGALYGEFARLHGKALGGEKTPDYVKRLERLHALFPRTRIVHIIRDGREVALSALDWATESKGPGRLPLWREEPVAVCALWWRSQVEPGRAAGSRIGPGAYIEVKYEDLVAEPERELRRLAAFLDLPYSEDMANYHRGKTRSDPGLSAKQAWLPPTAGLRDWRTALERRELALFEALAGDLLVACGYPLGAGEIEPQTRELARRCAERWTAETAARKRKRVKR